MSINVQQLSKGTEIDLVFLHGWGMNQGIWHPFSDLFRKRYSGKLRVRCIDLPGYGTEVTTRLNNYSLVRVSEWVASLICKPTIIVSWSMGGLIAQNLASQQNKHVIAQVQIASTPKFLQENDWPGIKPGVLAIFAKQLKIDQEVLLRRFLALQNMGLEQPKLSVNEMLALLMQYPQSSPEALSQSLELLNSTDLRESLQLSTLPCLRIYGKLDGLIPIKVVDKINSLCTSSEYKILEKASHAPFLSHPEETFSYISSFLETSIGLSSI